MFSQLVLSEKDARLLAYAGEVCGAPHPVVQSVLCAIADRKSAREAYERGIPAAPVADKCNHLRVTCDALARQLTSRQGACGVAYALLTCAEHQIAPALSDIFKKIFSSCSDPSPQELSLAASESGRAFASLRAHEGGVRRTLAFALCCALSGFRDDLTLSDGTLSYERLHLLYKIARGVFEDSDCERALLRGRAAIKIVTNGDDGYDILLAHERWILSSSNAPNAPP